MLTSNAHLYAPWPSDGRAAMTALAKLFPSMTRFDGTMRPGCAPWDAIELVNWLNTSGEVTSGSRHAALFLLSVWNADDWTAYGLKIRKSKYKEHRRIGRFDINDAWGSWDSQHRAAALAWFTNPFWP